MNILLLLTLRACFSKAIGHEEQAKGCIGKLMGLPLRKGDA